MLKFEALQSTFNLSIPEIHVQDNGQSGKEENQIIHLMLLAKCVGEGRVRTMFRIHELARRSL